MFAKPTVLTACKLQITRTKPNKLPLLLGVLVISGLILNINATCTKGSDYYFDETWCLYEDADVLTPYGCEDEC